MTFGIRLSRRASRPDIPPIDCDQKASSLNAVVRNQVAVELNITVKRFPATPVIAMRIGSSEDVAGFE